MYYLPHPGQFRPHRAAGGVRGCVSEMNRPNPKNQMVLKREKFVYALQTRTETQRTSNGSSSRRLPKWQHVVPGTASRHTLPGGRLGAKSPKMPAKTGFLRPRTCVPRQTQPAVRSANVQRMMSAGCSIRRACPHPASLRREVIQRVIRLVDASSGWPSAERTPAAVRSWMWPSCRPST